VKLADISGTNRRNIFKLKLRNLETNRKIKNIRDLYRGINDFKKGYQPRNNIVKDEKDDLFVDSHSILARFYPFQLLSVDKPLISGILSGFLRVSETLVEIKRKNIKFLVIL